MPLCDGSELAPARVTGKRTMSVETIAAVELAVPECPDVTLIVLGLVALVIGDLCDGALTCRRAFADTAIEADHPPFL